MRRVVALVLGGVALASALSAQDRSLRRKYARS
jgi:hypothetical protein